MKALVLSKLDYCNSLLLGMPKYLLHHLQKIQNMASRVINNRRKYDSVTEDMKNLHWLKIPEHIDYKVAVLIFQCINNQALTYLKVLLNINHNRFLRSSSSMLLPVSMSRLSIVHNSSFSIRGPRIWNELPIEVKRCSNINDFKCKLKNLHVSTILQFIISSSKFYSFYHLLLVLYVFLSVKCSRNDIISAYCRQFTERWNELPIEVKRCSNINDFKCKLKTYMFQRSYNLL